MTENDSAGLVVVDASALVETVIDGRHRDGAEKLLSRYEAARTPIFVTAAHGLLEAASALRRLTAQRAISHEQGGAALRWLAELNLVLDATTPRLGRIWELRERMSAYDAAYAVAAEALKAPLITTDRHLLRACEGAEIDAVHLDDLDAI